MSYTRFDEYRFFNCELLIDSVGACTFLIANCFRSGLYVFSLPKYCSEMNPIELEWQNLKPRNWADECLKTIVKLA